MPLLRRAYELWRELEGESGSRLLHQYGGRMMGPSTGRLISGARRSAELHAIPHETLSAEEIGARFPAFQPTDDVIGLLDPRAGYLLPEACTGALQEGTRRYGATLRFLEPLLSWCADGAGVRVDTPVGIYRAARLLFTAGGWTSELLPNLDMPLRIERQVLFWFEPRDNPERVEPGRCPVYLC